MPQSLLTGQLKEKPTYRVWCLYSSLVHAFKASKFSAVRKKKPLPVGIVKETEGGGLMTRNIVLIPWFQNSADSTEVPWNQYDVYCNKNMAKQILI